MKVCVAIKRLAAETWTKLSISSLIRTIPKRQASEQLLSLPNETKPSQNQTLARYDPFTSSHLMNNGSPERHKRRARKAEENGILRLPCVCKSNTALKSRQVPDGADGGRPKYPQASTIIQAICCKFLFGPNFGESPVGKLFSHKQRNGGIFYTFLSFIFCMSTI